jgi:hypothetical protein
MSTKEYSMSTLVSNKFKLSVCAMTV